MGTKYMNTTRVEFYKLYEDSGPSTAVFFILSPGVDPLKDVEKLGTTHVCNLYISCNLVGINIHIDVNKYILCCRFEAGIFH